MFTYWHSAFLWEQNTSLLPLSTSLSLYLESIYKLAVSNGFEIKNYRLPNSILYFSFIPSCWFTWRRQWHPTPVLLPGKSHGWRSLEGCSPWGHWGSGTTKRLHFHFSLSCIGEGNGNPLQCYCLKIPRDRGAWWAAVYGVAQSWTRLKWLSSWFTL